MKARLLLNQRYQIRADAFVAFRIWRVPRPVRGSGHDYKYALVDIVSGACVFRHGNEAGKGDHKHIGGVEIPYSFTAPAQLLADFWHDVDQWRPQ